MHHMDFTIVIKRALWAGGGGVKYRFYKSHNFRKFTGFWCGYASIKRDKTDSIVLILMKF